MPTSAPRADAGQQSQRAADRPAGGDARRRAFRRLGLLLVREVLRACEELRALQCETG